ncbi:unannotated protein [freshwater metagenome]|uniref:Unannotated protein n=1 Tax=freshwater metagenome TaxID=449393 RepID=A0A6J6NAB6_9ZZZZ
MNSSSKLSSSNASSCGAFQAATTGDSKGGVSLTSKSSTFSERSGRFDQAHVLTPEIFVKTSLTGVAVTTKTPKINTNASTGYVSTEVISATSGVVTP